MFPVTMRGFRSAFGVDPGVTGLSREPQSLAVLKIICCKVIGICYDFYTGKIWFTKALPVISNTREVYRK